MKPKRYLLIPLFLTLCCTAWSQTPLATDTLIFHRTEVYDMLIRLSQGKATQKTLDSAKVWLWEAQRELSKSDSNLKRLIAANDTLYKRVVELRTEKAGAIAEKNIAIADAESLKNKKNRAWGIGPQIGYNPFTRAPMAGVGISWNPIRFSLRAMKRNEAFGYQSAEMPVRIIK